MWEGREKQRDRGSSHSLQIFDGVLPCGLERSAVTRSTYLFMSEAFFLELIWILLFAYIKKYFSLTLFVVCNVTKTTI